MAFKRVISPEFEICSKDLLTTELHKFLVFLIRSENIEIFESYDLIENALLLRPKVEFVLGPTVWIQGFKSAQIFIQIIHPRGPITIGCRGGGVNEPRLVSQGPFAEFPCVEKIIVMQEIFVFFGGTRASSQMNNRANGRTVLVIGSNHFTKPIYSYDSIVGQTFNVFLL